VKRVLLRTLAVLGASGALALLARLAGGAAWGWPVFAACLAAALLHQIWQLARLARWLAAPLAEEVPEARGSWEPIFRALHRHEREAVGRQRELAHALERFRHAAQALPDGVVILDAENRIEWCNDTAASHLKLDARADAGQPIANLVRDPDFIAFLAGGHDPAPPALRMSVERGAALELQIIPYGQAQKLLLVREVTHAERVETMRRDFVANVSHELRTPLTVLVGFLETVRELKLDPQRVRDYLGMMQQQAARMQRIIDDLLTLSQLESAPTPPIEPVKVMPLLERVCSDARALSAGRHEITLQAEPTVDLLGSEAELASAFGNLAANAVRYTPAGGKVRLVWRENPLSASFTVEDTGVGIAPEHAPRLTERFYRVDRGRSRDTGGTGLGLAIVKHALVRHDARLEITSAPGRGSRFSAQFPAHRLRALHKTVNP
jgi:two-component system, OmpR family, phosphate regulon sensor histidine kinase PhoR